MFGLSPFAFMEFFVVLAFVAAWLVLERVCKRLDRDRDASEGRPSPAKDSRGE